MRCSSLGREMGESILFSFPIRLSGEKEGGWECICKSNVDLDAEPRPYIIDAIAGRFSFGFPSILLCSENCVFCCEGEGWRREFWWCLLLNLYSFIVVVLDIELYSIRFKK